MKIKEKYINENKHLEKLVERNLETKRDDGSYELIQYHTKRFSEIELWLRLPVNTVVYKGGFNYHCKIHPDSLGVQKSTFGNTAQDAMQNMYDILVMEKFL